MADVMRVTFALAKRRQAPMTKLAFTVRALADVASALVADALACHWAMKGTSGRLERQRCGVCGRCTSLAVRLV